MSERGNRLLRTADRQISELIGFFSKGGETGLSVPSPGREKLGDGTVGALASHTADSYLRIAAFLQATNQTSPAVTTKARTAATTRRRTLTSLA